MLFAFAEKKGHQVQTVYFISGNRQGKGHTTTLVAKTRLQGISSKFPICVCQKWSTSAVTILLSIEEEKKLFSPIYSLHVYSVQAVLPKDSAQLCAVDSSQAKELRKFADSNQIDGNRLAFPPYTTSLCSLHSFC